ncbi:MAG: hypothetical protein OMM_11510 [Candidatus Magnetoglobus multicellularis str. Araruama]|uniref:Uncharacterized protein n=1 Tax=Candidatus Magnetoglobus multicellularis str. Araruama TaxID=890399 RepID=A0A1V1NYD4_9BACT|nr:MAG: hypothetical protein OMM_11510 [Candidatus Magnetoglobus multicellularis str. Araruama]
MKRGLRIEEDHYLNMDSIVSWSFSNDSVSIMTPFNTEDNGILITTKKPGIVNLQQVHVVSIQEIKRITREIKEYMGIVL